MNQLISYADGPANMSFAFRSTTLDIITSYCFDRSYGAITFPSFEHPIIVGMQASIPILWLFKAFPIMHYIFPVIPDSLIVKINPITKGYVDLRAHLSAQIDELLANLGALDQADHEIVYHHLMTPQPSKSHFEIPSRKSLMEEVQNSLDILHISRPSLGAQSSFRRGTLHSFLSQSFLLKTDITERYCW